MAIQPIRKIVTPEIPDKLYFRIGDVARLCEVPAYVLRFWETEFPQLKPNKGGTGQRLYRRRDVEMALRIKSLLYDQGYTIPGARQVFKNEAKPEARAQAAPEANAPPAEASIGLRQAEPAVATNAATASANAAQLRALRAELESLLELLSHAPGASPADRRRGIKALPPVAPAPAVAMRPRLVVESRTRAENRPESQEPQSLRLIRNEQQGDLFGSDTTDEP